MKPERRAAHELRYFTRTITRASWPGYSLHALRIIPGLRQCQPDLCQHPSFRAGQSLHGSFQFRPLVQFHRAALSFLQRGSRGKAGLHPQIFQGHDFHELITARDVSVLRGLYPEHLAAHGGNQNGMLQRCPGFFHPCPPQFHLNRPGPGIPRRVMQPPQFLIRRRPPVAGILQPRPGLLHIRTSVGFRPGRLRALCLRSKRIAQGKQRASMLGRPLFQINPGAFFLPARRI